MDSCPSLTEQRPALLEVSFPNYRAATAFLLLPLFLLLIGKRVFQIATPACIHAFMEQLHLSNVKRKLQEKGKKNTDVVSSVTGMGAVSGQSTGQTARAPLFSEHPKLILIAGLVVMSQMRTALTCA